MKEFNLTQSYTSVEDMVNSEEVASFKNELAQQNIDCYAIISHIGNRYDVFGNKISGYAQNPYLKLEEVKKMKYDDIEKLVDTLIESAVATIRSEYEQKITALTAQHEKQLADAKEQAKVDLIAKLSS